MNVYHTIAVAKAGLPRLTIAQRVIDKIVRDALIYETETGEALAGLAIKPLDRVEPDLYVIDTISPDDSAIRRGAYFEQGDELQADIMNWWSNNWKAFPDHYRQPDKQSPAAKWNAALANLGNWHKHPGDLVSPSWGDTETALDDMFDRVAGTPYLLVFLATIWDKSADQANRTDSGEAHPIKVEVADSKLVRIDTWYMSRRTHRFARLVPTIVPDNTLPSLPSISWDLSKPDLWSHEAEALSKAGYTLATFQHDADLQPPMEICLILDKAKGRNVFIVVSSADYPASRPKIRITPTSEALKIPEDADYFLGLWAASQPLPDDKYPSWQWTPKRSLVELIQAVEEKLALNPTTAASKEKNT